MRKLHIGWYGIMLMIVIIVVALFWPTTCRAESVRPCGDTYYWHVGDKADSGGFNAMYATAVWNPESFRHDSTSKRACPTALDSLRSELSRVKATLDSLVRAMKQKEVSVNERLPAVMIRNNTTTSASTDMVIPPPKPVDSVWTEVSADSVKCGLGRHNEMICKTTGGLSVYLRVWPVADDAPKYKLPRVEWGYWRRVPALPAELRGK